MRCRITENADKIALIRPFIALAAFFKNFIPARTFHLIDLSSG